MADCEVQYGDSQEEFRWEHLLYQDQLDVAELVPYQQMGYVAYRRQDLDAVRTSGTDPCTVMSMGQQEDTSLTRQTVPSRYRRGYRHSNEIWTRVHARSSFVMKLTVSALYQGL